MKERTEFTTELGLGRARWIETAGTQPGNYIVFGRGFTVDANDLIRALNSMPPGRKWVADLTNQQWLIEPNSDPKTTHIVNAITWNPDDRSNMMRLHGFDESFSTRHLYEFMRWIEG